MSTTRAPSALARRSWLLSEPPRVSTSQRMPLLAQVAREHEALRRAPLRRAARRARRRRSRGTSSSLAMSSRSSPAAKPIAGTCGPPEVGDHAVVAPAADERAARAELLVRAVDLEERARVVVEPADEPRRRPCTACRARRGAARSLSKCVAVVRRRGSRAGWARPRRASRSRGSFESRMRSGLVARRRCESADSEPTFGVEVRDERLAVARARLGAAERVHEDLDVRASPSSPEEADEQVDHLGVAPGAGVAEDLGAELVELPVAPALRPLGPEHRARRTTSASPARLLRGRRARRTRAPRRPSPRGAG